MHIVNKENIKKENLVIKMKKLLRIIMCTLVLLINERIIDSNV